jgi:cell pole-organizing protein PopZ
MADAPSKELEKQILTFVTYAVPRVSMGAALKEDDLRAYRKIVPEYFRFMRTQTVKSHIELISANRKDPYFGPYVEKLLTPEGKKWLEKNIPIIIKVANEPE